MLITASLRSIAINCHFEQHMFGATYFRINGQVHFFVQILIEILNALATQAFVILETVDFQFKHSFSVVSKRSFLRL